MGAAIGIDAAEDRLTAVVAVVSFGIQVIDVSVPSDPQIRGSIDTGTANDVVLSADVSHAFFAETSNNSFTSVNIADPDNPFVSATTN